MTGQAISEEVRQFRGKLHSKWSGRTVMRFELVAEPKRAGEIAGERAADYMSLLQIFASPALILPLVSHVAPRGHDAVKQELATRFARRNEGTQRKAGREFARQVGMFLRESDKPLH